MKNINEKETYERIYAGWLGKNIGGTLGTPVEGRMEQMQLTWYPKLGDNGVLPNDDLDLQLVNLHTIEQYGLHFTPEQLGREWMEHVFYPYDEYGYAMTAMRNGLIPPFSGIYNNPFTDCMGAPIRSEIWAAIAMGNPDAAATFAWHDAVIDHAGGEGMWGEIFYAVLECLAYESNDLQKIIQKSLSYIPDTSRVYKAVSATLNYYNDGIPFEKVRGLILEHHGSENFTDAPQNLAFTIAGLLWGKDFEDGLLKTVNMGYDTDCTVATLGSIYGILYGLDFIPKKWSAPIGNKIVVTPSVRGLDAPKDIDELTARVIKQMKLLTFEDKKDFQLKECDINDFYVQRFNLPQGSKNGYNLSIAIKYENDNPSIEPSGTKKMFFHLENKSCSKWNIKLYIKNIEGFISNDESLISMAPCDSADYSVCITATDVILQQNHLTLVIERSHDNNIWTKDEIPFVLFRRPAWEINGKIVYIDGTKINFDTPKADGIYTAGTFFTLPNDRNVKIFCAGKDIPIKVNLDGEEIINSEAQNQFMPAYNRVPLSQTIEVYVKKGTHKVIATAYSKENPPCLMFGLTAPVITSEPGRCYTFLDVKTGTI